jgi:hypothetical protein
MDADCILERAVHRIFPDLQLEQFGAADAGPLPSLLDLITRGVCDTLPQTMTVSPETHMVVHISTALKRHVPATNVWYNLPPGFRPGAVAQIPGTTVKQTADGSWMVRTQATRNEGESKRAGLVSFYWNMAFCNPVELEDLFNKGRAAVCYRRSQSPVILFGSSEQ